MESYNPPQSIVGYPALQPQQQGQQVQHLPHPQPGQPVQSVQPVYHVQQFQTYPQNVLQTQPHIVQPGQPLQPLQQPQVLTTSEGNYALYQPPAPPLPPMHAIPPSMQMLPPPHHPPPHYESPMQSVPFTRLDGPPAINHHSPPQQASQGRQSNHQTIPVFQLLLLIASGATLVISLASPWAKVYDLESWYRADLYLFWYGQQRRRHYPSELSKYVVGLAVCLGITCVLLLLQLGFTSLRLWLPALNSSLSQRAERAPLVHSRALRPQNQECLLRALIGSSMTAFMLIQVLACALVIVIWEKGVLAHLDNAFNWLEDPDVHRSRGFNLAIVSCIISFVAIPLERWYVKATNATIGTDAPEMSEPQFVAP